MSVEIVHGLVAIVAAYAAIGLVVAVPFVIAGIGTIDPAARAAPWTFRALVFPGVVALWPYLLRRWLAHRSAS